MKKETKDCPNCEGAKYCISKPNKEDYDFPEEENQYLIDLECGIWDCHTAVLKLLKENKRLEKENAELSNSVTELTNSKTELENKVTELEKQIEKMKCCSNCSNFNSGNCKFSLRIKDDVTTFAKMHEDFFCINYDKWKLAE